MTFGQIEEINNMNKKSSLSDEEIELIKNNPKPLFSEIPKPKLMSNGYNISLTKDIIAKGKIEYYHMTIMDTIGETDPAEADAIAFDVLGENAKRSPGFLKNAIHYTKFSPL